MAISSNHTPSAMQSALTSYNFLKIPSTQGAAINTTYSIGAYPTVILIKPDKQIIEKDIWPISNTILRTAVTNAGGTPQSCITGIDAVKNPTAFNVYPTPASNVITIESGVATDTHYDIYNVTGEVVATGSIGRSGIKQLSVADLSEGHYFVKLYNNESLIGVKKFIVLK